MRIAHPFSNHNGGDLELGPDGALYAGMGDGGSENDPLRNGQNPDTLLSKLLRFDLAAAHPSPEIVHTGLRNPWARRRALTRPRTRGLTVDTD